MSKIKFLEEMNKSWNELDEYISLLESRIVDLNTEVGNLNAVLDKVYIEASSKVVTEFDPAIHNYKPSRPISRIVRDAILEAHSTIYKEGNITLPEFFSFVNAHIDPSASKTEIEGVIYNRFDIRLYK